jgi:hypothetical protein
MNTYRYWTLAPGVRWECPSSSTAIALLSLALRALHCGMIRKKASRLAVQGLLGTILSTNRWANI